MDQPIGMYDIQMIVTVLLFNAESFEIIFLF